MKPYVRAMLANAGRKEEREMERRKYDREDGYRGRERDERRMREVSDTGPYYPDSDTPWPVYGGPRTTRTYDTPKPVGKIGFSLDGEMTRSDEVGHNYPMSVRYDQPDEMSYRTVKKDDGYARGGYGEMTKDMAERWAGMMENEDGTTGPHWSLDQAKQVMAQRNISGSPYDFWLALNMMYSDYSAVAKKMGVNTVEFYACMADAFLNDKDAVDDKLAAYYEYVVQH